MIRHSSSLLISVVIHLVLLSLIIISYKKIYTPKKEVCKSRICMELCVLKAKKELKKEKLKRSEKPKKIKVKKVEKKQLVKKKVEVKKIKPLIIPIVQKVEEPEPIKKEVSETTNVEEIPEIKKEVVEIKPVKKSAKKIEEKERPRKENIIKEYIKINTNEISKLLKENLYYPRSARKRGITGKVVVKFVLSAEAEVSNVEVLESKSKILSRAAIKTIQNLSGEFPKPKEDITLHVPIGYSLR